MDETSELIKEIKALIDLEEVNGNFKCKCPYHDDAGNTLIILAEQETFHCFGCAEDGDLEKLLKSLKEKIK